MNLFRLTTFVSFIVSILILPAQADEHDGRQYDYAQFEEYGDNDVNQKILKAAYERDRELQKLEDEYLREIMKAQQEAKRENKPEKFESKRLEIEQKFQDQRKKIFGNHKFHYLAAQIVCNLEFI